MHSSRLHWALLLLLLLLLQQIRRTAPVKCFVTKLPPLIQPVELVECEYGVTGCHEFAYAYNISPHLVYSAGCGVQFPQFVQNSHVWLTVRKVKNCHHTDGCNNQLNQELMKSSRICGYAVASRVLGNRTVACLPMESRCYFEIINSPVPFYHAGCGACPAYALSCITCNLNHCNTTDDASETNERLPGSLLVAARAEAAPVAAAAAAPGTAAEAATKAAILFAVAAASCLMRTSLMARI